LFAYLTHYSELADDEFNAPSGVGNLIVVASKRWCAAFVCNHHFFGHKTGLFISSYETQFNGLFFIGLEHVMSISFKSSWNRYTFFDVLARFLLFKVLACLEAS
jgi:hypothetical protein